MPSTKPRVLVVDDNPTNLHLLDRALDKHGYAVLTTSSGQSALDLARLNRPDVILLDISLPDLDGLEVCRRLKQDSCTDRIPVIFVTAHSQAEDMTQAFAAGGCDYITVPFLLSEVLARVSVHLRLRHTEQELVRRNQELIRLSAQLAEMNVELARQSRIDPLTGLANRRAWQESAGLECERSNRTGSWYGVAYIDVDHFKLFNDSQGHQAGDVCLTRLAACIRDTCRSLDLVGRYGGEEFIVLFPETDADGAKQAGERIRTAIWELNIPHPLNPPAGRVTVSVGVIAGQGQQWEAMARRADAALYDAKRAGRNQVCQAGELPQEAVGLTSNL